VRNNREPERFGDFVGHGGSPLGGRSPSQALLPLAAWQGCMAFIVHATNHFQRMTDAHPSKAKPSGRAARGLDRFRSVAPSPEFTHYKPG
jgi:hypothetical protein